MNKLTLVVAAGVALAAGAHAQNNRNYQGPIPELAVNNTFRVICTCKNPKTQNPRPWPPLEPPGYAAQPGVKPGTRAWTHTPKLRAQAGAVASTILVQGITQAVFVGPAVQNFSQAKFYRFKQGIAPVTKSTVNKWQFDHAKSGKDVFSVASAPLKITSWAISENWVALTTPIPVPASTEWLFFAEFKGGEWRDDPKGGQTVGHDWKGGPGPAGGMFWGWTTGSAPNRRIVVGGHNNFRPKLGLLINEPVLTLTGNHANLFHSPNLAQEEYRALGACKAPWSTDNRSNMFVNVRAGVRYGSTGMAVVMLNVGRTWFPGTIPTQFGNLLLNPADPAISLLAGVSYNLQKNGIYNSGDQNPIGIPPLGIAAKGTIIKAQAAVFNSGFQNLALTTSSSVIVE